MIEIPVSTKVRHVENTDGERVANGLQAVSNPVRIDLNKVTRYVDVIISDDGTSLTDRRVAHYDMLCTISQASGHVFLDLTVVPLDGPTAKENDHPELVALYDSLVDSKDITDVLLKSAGVMDGARVFQVRTARIRREKNAKPQSVIIVGDDLVTDFSRFAFTILEGGRDDSDRRGGDRRQGGRNRDRSRNGRHSNRSAHIIQPVQFTLSEVEMFTQRPEKKGKKQFGAKSAKQQPSLSTTPETSKAIEQADTPLVPLEDTPATAAADGTAVAQDLETDPTQG